MHNPFALPFFLAGLVSLAGGLEACEGDKTNSAVALVKAGAQNEWRGRAEIIVEDDFSSGVSHTRVWIDAGGEELEVDFAGPPPRLTCGQTVKVKGDRIANRIVAADVTRLADEGLTPPCVPTGEQRVAVLVYEFPGITLSPVVTIPELRDVYFSKTRPSVDRFWREQSYGKVWVSGDVFGPIRMDRTHDPNKYMDALPDLLAAADRTVDLSHYNKFHLVWPVPEVSGWGGRGVLGCYDNLISPSKGKLKGSFVVFLAGTRQSHESMVGIAAHEGGHNFSLHHADTLDYAPLPLGSPGMGGIHNEYPDAFSNMGSPSLAGSPAVLGGHWAAPHKAKLGWLDRSTNLRDIETPGTYRLRPYEMPAAGLQSIRIRRGPASDEWLWLEYRQPVGYDAPLKDYSNRLFNGVLIHYEDPQLGYPDRSLLLDFHAAATPRDFKDAVLNTGETWGDPYGPLVIHVGDAGSDGIEITVAYEAACTALASAGAHHGFGEESGTIEVIAPGGCAWLAASYSDWITITGRNNGDGAGLIAYRVAANNSRNSRIGLVSVGRSAFTVTQDGTQAPNRPPAALSISPSAGTGFNQTFTVVFSDPDGVADLAYAWITVRAADTFCVIDVPRFDDQHLFLRSDDGTMKLGPVTAGSPGKLKNSQCEVDAAGASITSAGNEVTVELPIAFATEWVGFRGTGAGVVDGAGASAVTSLGSWTVGQKPPLAPVITPSGIVNAASYRSGALAPGEIITIFGAQMGPPSLTSHQLTADGRHFAVTLAGTRVLFDEAPAPLVYVSANQLSAIVPYAVGGKGHTQLRVSIPNGTSDTISIPVAASAAGVFSLDATGAGQGAILNQDYSGNNPSSPAPRGSVVMIYMTGEGLTDPPGEDGRIAGATPCKPKLRVTARIGGKDARVLYAGSAPSLVAGVMQVNVEVPADAPPGGYVPLVVAVGGSTSQQGITLAVR